MLAVVLPDPKAWDPTKPAGRCDGVSGVFCDVNGRRTSPRSCCTDPRKRLRLTRSRRFTL